MEVRRQYSWSREIGPASHTKDHRHELLFLVKCSGISLVEYPHSSHLYHKKTANDIIDALSRLSLT